MAILNRLSRHEIRTRFTHWGLLLGVVPIYAGLVVTGVFEDGAVEYDFDIRDNETKDAKAYNLASMEALGLGYDFLNRVLDAIDSTTLEEFNNFIRGVLDPEKALTITVGPTR